MILIFDVIFVLYRIKVYSSSCRSAGATAAAPARAAAGHVAAAAARIQRQRRGHARFTGCEWEGVRCDAGQEVLRSG